MSFQTNSPELQHQRMHTNHEFSLGQAHHSNLVSRLDEDENCYEKEAMLMHSQGASKALLKAEALLLRDMEGKASLGKGSPRAPRGQQTEVIAAKCQTGRHNR
eukprot:250355-Pelagomonas_calceolata.AAC.1